MNLVIKMCTKSLGAHRCRESLGFTVSVTSCEDVAVTHSCCTDHVAQNSQASWREISVWERNAKRNTHHLWCAVCTFIWSSDCLSHIHPSTGLYGYSHSFKICSNSQVALALSRSPFEMDMFVHCLWLGTATVDICVFPPVTFGKYGFSFPTCTWSSSLQRFPVQSGLKDSRVLLDVCSQNQSVKDEQLVCAAKGEPEI